MPNEVMETVATTAVENVAANAPKHDLKGIAFATGGFILGTALGVGVPIGIKKAKSAISGKKIKKAAKKAAKKVEPVAEVTETAE